MLFPTFIPLLFLPVHGQRQSSVADYAPLTNGNCPDITNTKFVREWTPTTQGLHPGEQTYIQTRNSTVIQDAWQSWIGDASQLGYTFSSLAGHFPLVGLVLPGGGLRASLFGAAALNALDSRNQTSKAAGTGGLLQVASYLTGLSGGSWAVGSFVLNNMPLLPALVQGNGADLGGWLVDLPLDAPDGLDLFSEDNQYFFGSVLWGVASKAAAGIDTSIVDTWGRIIGYHFLNQTNRNNFFSNDTGHGSGELWSDIPQVPAFQSFEMPFPIVVTDSRPHDDTSTAALPLDPTVYEITPFELASWDPSLSAGTNLSTAGTYLNNGRPDNGTSCVSAFDQASFVMGTSAGLFNQIFDFANNKLVSTRGEIGSGLFYLLQRQVQDIRARRDDVANWPNPFQGVKSDTFHDSSADFLQLVDGATNGENIPYNPLFVNVRGVDLIVTLESSADTTLNWPNGTGVLTTDERLTKFLQPSHRRFPPTPQTADDFVSTGVNSRPTFFGCDPVNNPPEYPLVLYLPNSPPIDGGDPVTNTATFRLSYTPKHVQLFLDQVFDQMVQGFTPNANTPDANYPICLQCAAVDRARLRASVNRSDICTKCFQQYCYDPKNPPSKNILPNRRLTFVDPDPQGLDRLIAFFEDNKFKMIGAMVGFVAALGLLIGGLIWYKKRQEKQEYQMLSEYAKAYSVHDVHDVHDASAGEYEMPIYRGV
ncbi:phospholipase B [Mycena floridula]|nr:phospholipase B [Mycena floridula]